MKPFRIGAGAGYAGDRIDPAVDLAERGQLDALVFECLAERTIALAQLRRRADPEQGYDPLLAARLRAVLPACLARGIPVITNMGAANPLAAGHAALAVARELQLPRLRVAVVLGDDVLDWVRQHDAPLLDSRDTVRSLDGRLISANAYLGADALLPALQADVAAFERWAAQGLIKRVDFTHLMFLIWSSTQAYADLGPQYSLYMGKPALDEEDFERARRLLTDIIWRSLQIAP